MKQTGVFLILMLAAITARAQQIESIHFHLYTDSLKKGTYNYINIDGKMSDGSWLPLTDKELRFTTDYGKFEGNSLVLPDAPTVQKVSITVALKQNPKMTQSTVIWIKQKPDPPLPKYESDAPRGRKRR
ncbi:hypothetical protein [Niabella sp.]|uniref:hypothetical protein n=1 Tax=Niabella sp. TaxID=1962976 RepID=UPI0026113CE2|nr:hypothetical protein [Niabella sp.]